MADDRGQWLEARRSRHGSRLKDPFEPPAICKRGGFDGQRLYATRLLRGATTEAGPAGEQPSRAFKSAPPISMNRFSAWGLQ